MTAEQVFTRYFAALEKAGIPSVVLHGYATYPSQISSDVDVAVRDTDLPRALRIQHEVARECGWVVAQRLQHEYCAWYSVLVSPDSFESLKLDICSHYLKQGTTYLEDEMLLTGRQPFRSFFVPRPGAEFIYLLAKLFVKNKPPENVIGRLRELHAQDPAFAEEQFSALFGPTGRTAEQWLQASPEELKQLKMRGWKEGLPRKVGRFARRILRPTGLHVTLLGPDGTGKSTLISAVRQLLEPCFRRQMVIHFRPMMFEHPSAGSTVSQPHAQAPRPTGSSLMKVCYYYADHLTGYFARVLPARTRSTLVIFDRSFEDMLVDPKRYRLQGTHALVRVLRRCLPCPDLTFVLDGTPEVIHKRKPELTVPELERQRTALRELSQKTRCCTVVSADQTPEAVAKAVAGRMLKFLAERLERGT